MWLLEEKQQQSYGVDIASLSAGGSITSAKYAPYAAKVVCW